MTDGVRIVIFKVQTPLEYPWCWRLMVGDEAYAESVSFFATREDAKRHASIVAAALLGLTMELYQECER